MTQRLKDSALEAIVNTIVGFVGSWLLTFVALPLIGMTTPSISQAFGLTVIYTIWSLVRSFGVRRAFIAWGQG